jgi:acetyl esterase
MIDPEHARPEVPMSTEITDPEVLEFISKANSFYPPNAVEFSVDDQRRVYNALCDGFRQPRPEGLKVTDETLGGPGGPIPVRRYAPAHPQRVTVIYFHGGGYLLGGLDSHDDVCAEIAARTRCPVVSVDYRLCPEHPHPAAYEDALAATRTLLAKGPVVLAGDSAGGNLAAAVAQTLRDAAIKGQVLIYPGLGGQLIDLPSYEECAKAPLLTVDDVQYYRQIRSGGKTYDDDPTFYPLAAEDFAGLAPCFISAAGVDPLRDDGVEYDRCLVGAGVEAYCAVEPQLPHGFLRARTMSHRAAAAFDRIVEAISDFASRKPPKAESPWRRAMAALRRLFGGSGS